MWCDTPFFFVLKKWQTLLKTLTHNYKVASLNLSEVSAHFNYLSNKYNVNIKTYVLKREYLSDHKDLVFTFGLTHIF
jgi:hypothetical protein